MGLLLASLLTGTAHAQSPGAVGEEAGATEASAKERARALYERGAKAYSEGKYHEAAQQFLAAHDVFPTRELLFNVAKAFDRADSRSAALAYYRQYVRAEPGAVDDEVKRRIEALSIALAERGLQQLSVIADPEDALVLLDGKPVGLAPWTGETWPGKHRVRVELSGYVPFETLALVEPTRPSDVTLKLERLPPAPIAPTNPALAERPPEPPSVAPLTWVVLGTGTAALATALFVEMANGENTGISRTSAFFAGAGLSASALGGLLLYVDLSAAPSASRAGSLTPNQRPHGAIASVGARF